MLVAIGLDHTTASIALRESVAFVAEEVPAALAHLTDPAGLALAQAAILSTCNRVELYGLAHHPCEDALAAFLANRGAIAPDVLADALYVHRRDEVVHHLGATAAGLCSLVLGEAQIQGQVRAALDQAPAAGTAGPELRRLFESAIAAGRRVRSRTRIGRGAMSLPHAGVELARRRLGGLSDATVLLIGTGSTAELAAKHVAKSGANQLLVIGRDRARAARLAWRYGGDAVIAGWLDEALARSDVVVSCTAAPDAIVHVEQMQRVLARRHAAQRLVLIDLAMPRDVDPRVAGLPGVDVYTLDDLSQLIASTQTERRAELPAAYAELETETGRFTRWLCRRQIRQAQAVAAGL